MGMWRVFYESWQMECCGTPFSVGEEVSWPLAPMDPEDIRAWSREGEHDRYDGTVRFEGHGGRLPATRGRVLDIRLVRQEYAERSPGAHTLEPVSDTRLLTPVDACPKWFEHEEPRTKSGLRRARLATGVLVTLDVPGAPPPELRDRP
ncbi:DUF6578 domain-containing protein [Streptomyces sp. NPDC001406]|uniref:DUF6578 domain-containing protein n=1 Tax=Streptomyces sp. NPDC001406 TaxID=3364572 RepID=UPI00368B746C